MTVVAVQNWTVASKADGSGSSISNTLTSVPTAGNLVFCALASGTNGIPSLSSFADNFGDGVSWTAHASNGGDHAGNITWVYWKVVGTPSGGGKAVTATISGTQSLDLFVVEYGLASGTPSWAVDGTPVYAFDNNPTVADAGDITTSGSDDVIVGFNCCTGGLFLAGTSYTRRATSTQWTSDGVEDRFVTSPSTYAVDWTSGGGDDSWVAFGVAFRADAGGGPVTHSTSGALTSQGSAMAGTAAHIAKHPTSGALTGQGAAVVGAGRRFRAHANSGTLAGQGATLAGTAVHLRPHATLGALAAQGAVISGAAARSSPGIHPTNGALVGQGSSVAGTAAHIAVHGTSGILVGQRSLLSGQAQNGANIIGATPGFYRQDYERWKTYRKRKEEEEREPDSPNEAALRPPPSVIADLDAEIKATRDDTRKINARIAEIERELEQEISKKKVAALERERLLKEQEIAFIKAREQAIQEEMEVAEVALLAESVFIAVKVLTAIRPVA